MLLTLVLFELALASEPAFAVLLIAILLAQQVSED